MTKQEKFDIVRANIQRYTPDQLIAYFQSALMASLNDVDQVDEAFLDIVIQFQQLNPTMFDRALDAAQQAAVFGKTLMKKFIAQNILLGITQRGLTSHVRKNTREVKECLETGSLYDAIDEVRILPASIMDDTILTPARLLSLRNEVEVYLRVPLATSYDQGRTW